MCQTNVDYEVAKKIAEKFDGRTPVHSKMIAKEIKKREKENIKQIASNLDDRTPVHSQMIAAEMKK